MSGRFPLADPDGDCFEGTCPVCATHGVFHRNKPSLREGYKCPKCRASLRYQGQADALLRTYARNGATSIAQLVKEPEFAALRIWEPGVLGPLRKYFKRLAGYVVSDYAPDAAPGEVRDGIRCEDIMQLTFGSESFDLVITSDVFEHVRHPDMGFAEVHRVLRPGGRHIFSIPAEEPLRQTTRMRVDVSGDDDVFLEEPHYHAPRSKSYLVYNDFGRDLVDRLDEIGFDTDVIRFESANSEAARLLTFRSTKRTGYPPSRERLAGRRRE